MKKPNPLGPKPPRLAPPPSPKCSHTTRRGQPCRAPVVPGTDPPTCAIHAGRTASAGAPRGNQNRTAHGFYSAALRPDEIADLISYAHDLSLDDEIACARVCLRRLLDYLNDPDQPVLENARLVALALAATRTIARLLRDKRALSGEAADGISGAIAQALDELSTEWGVQL